MSDTPNVFNVRLRDLCAGDAVKWEETVYQHQAAGPAAWRGAMAAPRARGRRTIVASVVRVDRGQGNGRDMASLEVAHAHGIDPLPVGAIIKRSVSSLLAAEAKRAPWANEGQRHQAMRRADPAFGAKEPEPTGQPANTARARLARLFGGGS